MKTKFILITAFIYLINFSGKAQDSLSNSDYKHIIKLSPLGFIQKARIGYEYSIGSKGHLTIGALGAYYYNSDYSGILIEPFVRKYLTHKSEGLYLQGKLSVGRVKSTVYYSDASISNYDQNGILISKNSLFSSDKYQSKELTTIAGSLSIGYQKFFGSNKRWVFDVNVGVQISNYFNKDYSQTINGMSGSKQIIDYSGGKIYPYYGPNSPYEFTNPGSFITSNLQIGYRF